MPDPAAGWHIDPSTLRPVITDEQAFREQHSSDPALEVLVALWGGDPHAAMVALSTLLDTDGDHWRWRALRADIHRDLGEHEHAIVEYEELVGDHAGTDREAVLIQHLGKAQFAANHYDEAASCFERALQLRSASGADPSLVACRGSRSTRHADAPASRGQARTIRPRAHRCSNRDHRAIRTNG
jgi:tetratricopeptide (TPR) repeat protein